MSFLSVTVNGVEYSTDPSHPRSMRGSGGRGYASYLFPMIEDTMEVCSDADDDAAAALAARLDAEDALADALIALAATEQARDDAAEALEDALDALAAADAFDPANYARSDAGQSPSINAIWTFLQNIILTDKDVVRNSIVQTRITKRAIVATGSSSITFPASPTNMDRAIFYFDGDYQSSPAVIGRNGSNVNGVAEDLTVDNINGVEVVEFEYYQAASSWGVV
ncbi:MAG: hypothetical protein CL484_07610 [Acidobacteria bacterium]|nr:hypothetical protein [Acidobacteriota bacterium]